MKGIYSYAIKHLNKRNFSVGTHESSYCGVIRVGFENEDARDMIIRVKVISL